MNCEEPQKMQEKKITKKKKKCEYKKDFNNEKN